MQLYLQTTPSHTIHTPRLPLPSPSPPSPLPVLLGGYLSPPSQSGIRSKNNTPSGPSQRAVLPGPRDGSKGGILDPDSAPHRRNSDDQNFIDSSTMGGSRSGSMSRDRFNVTAPASTFATPVAALSFSGAEYSQGVGAGSGAL